jgi:hypothetical protein
MKRKCITIMSDRDCRYYVVPTTKETKFLAWEASVIGGEEGLPEEEYTGEDFLDYQIDRPLATLALSNPYRRFARRHARLSGLRDIRDVRDVRD